MSRLSGEKLKRIGTLASFAAALTVCFGLECMDRFAMSVTDDVLTVDTGTVIQGPPIGTNTTGQEAEGPHCVGGAAAAGHA